MLLPSPLNSVSESITLLLQRPNSSPYPNIKGNDMLCMTTPHDGYEWVYIDIGLGPTPNQQGAKKQKRQEGYNNLNSCTLN